MPLKLSFLRSLIACGLLTGTCAVAAPVPQEALWTCTSVSDGKEWDCNTPEEVSSQPQSQTDPEHETPQQIQQVTSEAKELPTLAQPEQVTQSDNAPALVAEPTDTQKKTTEAQPLGSIQSQSTVETETALSTPTALQSKETQSETDYLTAYPEAYRLPTPAPETSPLPGREQGQQWDCRSGSADEQWECERIGISTYQPPSQHQHPAQSPYAYLDWYANPKTDPITHCSGSYIQPAFDLSADAGNEEKPGLYMEAASSSTQLGGLTRLKGGVYLQQGPRQLRSQYAELDQVTHRAQMIGLVQFRVPNLLMLGDRAELDTQSGETQIDNARFVLHDSHLRGEARRLFRQPNGEVRIEEGSYTRCEPGNDSWLIKGEEIVLRPESGFGSAKNATLRVGGVPVLYVPYIYFPIDDSRQSGFLTPSLSSTEDNGLDIAAPYYFNLAPNMDDTLSPRYIRKRGAMLENEFRYLNPWGDYRLSTSLLPDDDITGEDRWLLAVNHQGEPAQGWTSHIDATTVSDNGYFNDLNTGLSITKETHLKRIAAVDYQAQNWRFDASLRGYQTVDRESDTPYQKLPELRLSGQLGDPLQGFDASYFGEYAFFDRDPSGLLSPTTNTDLINGHRAHLETTLNRPFEWPGAYVRPSLRLTHTQYQLEDEPASNNNAPSRTLPLLSIDSGLTFDRQTTIGGKDYTQTLEPRLFYLYVPSENQDELPHFDSSELTFSYDQLFRDNRFSGLDRIADANQFSLGLTSRFLEQGARERFRASIGQIFYLEDRDVSLDPSIPDPLLSNDESSLAAEALWLYSDQLRLTADAQWEANDYSNTDANIKATFQSDLDRRLSLGYRFSETDGLEQSDLSFIWPLSAQWSVLGRWLRDIKNNESLDSIFGLEYENCCWKIRMVKRHWIDDDLDDRSNDGVFLQFVLKGLGSVGAKAAGSGGPGSASFLEDITGFNEREEND